MAGRLLLKYALAFYDARAGLLFKDLNCDIFVDRFNLFGFFGPVITANKNR